MEDPIMDMRRKAFFLFALCSFLFSTSAGHADYLFTATRVLDGDRITCQGYGVIFRVRLAGIDAPEKGSEKRPGQPYAEEAGKYLESLILDKLVAIEQVGLDSNNLVLGIVYRYGQNINLEMVKQGFAEVYQGKHKFDIQPFSAAEKEAKEKKLNIWSAENYVSPREWRKGKH